MRTPPACGAREAHAHLWALGEALVTPSVDACRSVEECLEVVAARAGATRAGGWIRLRGARPEGWAEHRWPTRAEIDGASGGHPCVVKSFDHHHAVAGSAALRAAGLRAGQRVGTHGEVVADAHGEATGLLREQAAWAVWEACPAPSATERTAGARAALEHLRALGFDEVHDLLTPAWMGPVLASLHDSGELPMRVRLYAALDERGAFSERPWERETVRLAGLKVFADGTLNARTAYSLHPYREPVDDRHAPDGDWHGSALMTPGELDGALACARALGLGLAVHAIGDGAVRMVLDARERAGSMPERTPGGFPALRVEHAELVDEADIGRFAKMGVTCSVQPCHLLYDVEALTRYLPHRLERVLPLRELIDAGCVPGELLWFGSDVPIVPADPRDSVHAAVERGRRGAPESARIAPAQAISEADAWRCFGARSA